MEPADLLKAWRIHFFQRAPVEDEPGSVPAQEFLDSLPPSERAKIVAILDAVAAAPPPAFSGGGYWHAMHGEMSGFYETRTRASGRNQRLVCVLERPGDDLGGPSIVCLGGFAKRLRSAAHMREYRRMREYRAEFLETRRVLR